MSSDLVQKFPTLGECNRYTNGMCSTRSCLIRGGWRQGDAVDYDLATCETRDIRKTIEALESEIIDLKNVRKSMQGWIDHHSALADKAEARAERLRAVLKPRLNAKALEALKEILEAMEGLNEADAPYLKTLLDWHERARKALEDDKQ